MTHAASTTCARALLMSSTPAPAAQPGRMAGTGLERAHGATTGPHAAAAQRTARGSAGIRASCAPKPRVQAAPQTRAHHIPMSGVTGMARRARALTQRAARGDQVVHQHHALPRLYRAHMHLDAVCAVLGDVVGADGGAGQLAGLPQRHKSAAERHGQGRTKDEAPGLETCATRREGAFQGPTSQAGSPRLVDRQAEEVRTKRGRGGAPATTSTRWPRYRSASMSIVCLKATGLSMMVVTSWNWMPGCSATGQAGSTAVGVQPQPPRRRPARRL